MTRKWRCLYNLPLVSIGLLHCPLGRSRVAGYDLYANGGRERAERVESSARSGLPNIAVHLSKSYHRTRAPSPNTHSSQRTFVNEAELSRGGIAFRPFDRRAVKNFFESSIMLQAALLALVIATNASEPSNPVKTPIQQCFATMDGAVYHGDPSNRTQMKADVAACESGIRALQRMRPTAAQGPGKLFLTGRILDRAATLSYMGLDDASTALREVRTANLYFRVAAGLPSQSADYRAAAWANVKLTEIQLNTLHADIAARVSTPRTVAAVRVQPAHADGRMHAQNAYTAYHRP